LENKKKRRGVCISRAQFTWPESQPDSALLTHRKNPLPFAKFAARFYVVHTWYNFFLATLKKLLETQYLLSTSSHSIIF